MGYSHYWENKEDCPADRWATICTAVRKLLASNPQIRVAFECDEPNKPPQIDDDVIRFNGHSNMAYETFTLDRRWCRDNCKTGGRPYDVLVVAVLTIAHNVSRSTWQIRSDGKPNDWSPGMKLAAEALGKPVVCPIEGI